MARLSELWFIGPSQSCRGDGGLKLSGSSQTNEKYKSYKFVSGGVKLATTWVMGRIIIRTVTGKINISGTESYQIYYPTYSSPPRTTKIIRQVKNYSTLERV